MTDYTKLVQALRCAGLSKQCDSCGYGFRYCPDSACNDACHVERIISEAADAIEALNRLVDLNTERCEALRKQLREAHESYERHLNELEAQLPKRSEIVRCRECKWYSIYEAKKDGTPDKRYSPSVCLRETYAKRRDPDWFCADGEMEVQE